MKTLSGSSEVCVLALLSTVAFLGDTEERSHGTDFRVIGFFYNQRRI